MIYFSCFPGAESRILRNKAEMGNRNSSSKLVVDMNAAATPDTKIDAAIAVINEIVAQHKKMHERMAEHGMKHHD